MIYKVAIVGGGPAGIAAAIQLKRSGIEPVIFEQKRVGGLLHNANRVENYIGFPGGIRGPKLVNLFEKQIKRHEIEIIYKNINLIGFASNNFILKSKAERFAAERVILATGTTPNRLRLPGVDKLTGDKIFYEVSDINEVESKNIAIIGGGDAAFDYALNLAGNRNNITIYVRGDKTSCLPLLATRSINDPNIEIHLDHKLSGIIDQPEEVELLWDNGDSNSVDYLLIAIGRTPVQPKFSRDLLSSLNELENSGKIFRIGDLVNGQYRQLSISTGDGIKTAMIIAELLKA
jgi:thioredoxin reductase (NADPH)